MMPIGAKVEDAWKLLPPALMSNFLPAPNVSDMLNSAILVVFSLLKQKCRRAESSYGAGTIWDYTFHFGFNDKSQMNNFAMFSVRNLPS
jgi:hypothetical protein